MCYVHHKDILSPPSCSYQSLAELCGVGKVITTGGSIRTADSPQRCLLCLFDPLQASIDGVDPLFWFWVSVYVLWRESVKVRGWCHMQSIDSHSSMLRCCTQSRVVTQKSDFLSLSSWHLGYIEGCLWILTFVKRQQRKLEHTWASKNQIFAVTCCDHHFWWVHNGLVWFGTLPCWNSSTTPLSILHTQCMSVLAEVSYLRHSLSLEVAMTFLLLYSNPWARSRVRSTERKDCTDCPQLPHYLLGCLCPHVELAHSASLL